MQQLSVFAGGWTLEAAEGVCSVADDVFDLLTQLVNKSLVVVEHEAAGQARYRLLETIRQYARDKLFEAGDVALGRERHLRYFLRLALQTEPELLGPRMVPWLNRFEQEHDNFRAALEWALETDPLAALNLASALVQFWARRNYIAEGLGWLEAALARLEAARAAAEAGTISQRQYQLARARGLGQRAWMDFGLASSVSAARAAAEESVHLARQLGDEHLLGWALTGLAMTAIFWADPAVARAAAEEAQALVRKLDDSYSMIYTLGAMEAGDLIHTFNLTEARRLQDESMALARRLGNPWLLAQVTQSGARIAVAEGDLGATRALFEESTRLFAEIGDITQMNAGRSDLAHALRRHGRSDEALALYHETIRAWQHLGASGAVAHQLESLAVIAVAQSQPARAARLLGAAETLRSSVGAGMMPAERAEYDQALAELRDRLPAAELEAAWASGRTMGMDEAIEYALGDE